MKKEYSKKNIKLNTILDSEEFKQALFKKLNIPKNIDGWNVYKINKDLNGYEISPHPDITGKVITYQLNLSNTDALDNYDLGTRFHSIKPEFLKDIKQLSKKNQDLGENGIGLIKVNQYPINKKYFYGIRSIRHIISFC